MKGGEHCQSVGKSMGPALRSLVSPDQSCLQRLYQRVLQREGWPDYGSSPKNCATGWNCGWLQLVAFLLSHLQRELRMPLGHNQTAVSMKVMGLLEVPTLVNVLCASEAGSS